VGSAWDPVCTRLEDAHACLDLAYYCEGAGPWTTPTKRVKVPEEKDWERMLDCLSLGLCHLFE
jgi:hypothetical protein